MKRNVAGDGTDRGRRPGERLSKDAPNRSPG
jgi:hypothetical protein